MPYIVGTHVMYTAVGGKKESAEVLVTKENLSSPDKNPYNASGNFDYLVSVERNNKTEYVMCRESELTPI